jgi:hypothetical protein
MSLAFAQQVYACSNIRTNQKMEGWDEAYGYVIHNWDSIYSRSTRGIEIDGLDRIKNAIQIAPGECRLRTLQSAQCVESFCTMIPLNEGHVRQTLKGWLAHYNHGRPHSRLGPGIPKPLGPNVEQQTQRHRNSDDHRITKTPISMGCITIPPGENCRMMLPSNQGGSIYCGGQGRSHRIHQIVNTNSVRVVNGPNSLFDAPGVIVRRQPFKF